MSVIIRCRSRLCSTVPKKNRPFSSSVSAEPPREPIISSSTIIPDQPPPPTADPIAEKSSWSFLKYGLLTSLTGGLAYLGYASYAYPLDQIEQKAKALRSSANVNIGDDASSLEKFQGYLRAAALAGPAKLVDVYIDLRKLAEEHIRGFTEPISDKLLPDLHPMEQHVFTLVLDLTETLIYSDWKRERGWRTYKRPGVDYFLEQLAQYYEIVLYSDQLNMYVEPVVDRLDPKHCIRYRLSRGATRYVDGKHYRDLSMLNRDPARVLYISAHALESSLQPENSIPIKLWQGAADDTALLDLIPFLEYVAKNRPADIRKVLASYQGHDIPQEFIKRSQEHARRMGEQKGGLLWRR